MTESLTWKVHTPNLLQEIGNNNNLGIMRIPLMALQGILGEVAQRAIELDDARLHLLMCRLALYESADPTSKSYDHEIFKKLKAKIRREGK